MYAPNYQICELVITLHFQLCSGTVTIESIDNFHYKHIGKSLCTTTNQHLTLSVKINGGQW